MAFLKLLHRSFVFIFNYYLGAMGLNSLALIFFSFSSSENKLLVIKSTDCLKCPFIILVMLIFVKWKVLPVKLVIPLTCVINYDFSHSRVTGEHLYRFFQLY